MTKNARFQIKKTEILQDMAAGGSGKLVMVVVAVSKGEWWLLGV